MYLKIKMDRYFVYVFNLVHIAQWLILSHIYLNFPNNCFCMCILWRFQIPRAFLFYRSCVKRESSSAKFALQTVCWLDTFYIWRRWTDLTFRIWAAVCLRANTWNYIIYFTIFINLKSKLDRKNHLIICSGFFFILVRKEWNSMSPCRGFSFSYSSFMKPLLFLDFALLSAPSKSKSGIVDDALKKTFNITNNTNLFHSLYISLEDYRCDSRAHLRSNLRDKLSHTNIQIEYFCRYL